MKTLLEDIDRIVLAAVEGEPLNRLEALALADSYTRARDRAQALESALDTAQLMIDRPAATGQTQPLSLAMAA